MISLYRNPRQSLTLIRKNTNLVHGHLVREWGSSSFTILFSLAVSPLFIRHRESHGCCSQVVNVGLRGNLLKSAQGRGDRVQEEQLQGWALIALQRGKNQLQLLWDWGHGLHWLVGAKAGRDWSWASGAEVSHGHAVCGPFHSHKSGARTQLRPRCYLKLTKTQFLWLTHLKFFPQNFFWGWPESDVLGA